MRRLEWEACYNARDIGGYRTVDGSETRWGAIVRSDDLCRLTEAGQAAVIEYGIRTVVDLRAPSELTESPHPFAEPGKHGITYMNLPFFDDNVGPWPTFSSIAEGYAEMLKRCRREVAAIVTAIARAPEGGVLVHCQSGRDRTGQIVALLLALAGVPAETIAADYALSVEYLKPWEAWWLENGPGEREERERELHRLHKLAAGPEEIMPAVLARLEMEYGGVEAYLLGASIEKRDIEALRDRLRA